MLKQVEFSILLVSATLANGRGKAKKEAKDYLQQKKMKAEQDDNYDINTHSLIPSKKPKFSSHSTETKHYDNIRNVTKTSVRYGIEIRYGLDIATASFLDA